MEVTGAGGAGTPGLGRPGAWVRGAPAEWMGPGAVLDVGLGGRRWVTEGIYLWAIDDVLEDADIVVWLDLPYRTCIRRIVVRHAVASARGNNRHKGLRNLWNFAWGARRYWTTTTPRSPTGPTDWSALTRAQTKITLEPHRAKVVHLRSRHSVDAWLTRSRESSTGFG